MTPLFFDSIALFGVVPVFVNMGAALLPAILAGLASVLGLLFKPRELFRLCLRKPWVPILVIGLAVGGYFDVPWLFGLVDESRQATTTADVNPRPDTGSDWSAVALEVPGQRPRKLAGRSRRHRLHR